MARTRGGASTVTPRRSSRLKELSRPKKTNTAEFITLEDSSDQENTMDEEQQPLTPPRTTSAKSYRRTNNRFKVTAGRPQDDEGETQEEILTQEETSTQEEILTQEETTTQEENQDENEAQEENIEEQEPAKRTKISKWKRKAVQHV